MKKSLLFFLLFLGLQLFSQQLYNPTADAEKDIDNAILKAQQENKYVILQVGGNWCKWCILFDKFINENQKIKEYKDQNFIYYHLNYSKENKNEKLLKRFKNPNRFGFPVLLVLNDKGELIHTQDTSYLEDGESYSEDKVLSFFENWSKDNFVE